MDPRPCSSFRAKSSKRFRSYIRMLLTLREQQGPDLEGLANAYVPWNLDGSFGEEVMG